ncbi:MAG TPA: Sir2 family NAD-dependent protein deacetylase [Lachnospiraceae bacterium]|jgi:NAD-dependent deacetylase|nr:Sir2 family NAD-dependent protein deacetylase [Lachnospiraceae bacterium]
MDNAEKIDKLTKMISNSNNIVCMLGIGMGMECGLPNRWSNEEAYRVEREYKYSPEEIYSAVFFNTRTELFYEYYKKECLRLDYTPSVAYDALLRLEATGKLRACITHNIQSMAVKAGLSNVIELHGSIHDNKCPKCGKRYSAEYMRDAVGVPLCEDCKAPIRPLVKLQGEQIRNDRMTEAANVSAEADMIMVLGINLNHPMVKTFTNYYTGSRLVLVTKNEHFTDKNADLCIHDEVKKILPLVI